MCAALRSSLSLRTRVRLWWNRVELWRYEKFLEPASTKPKRRRCDLCRFRRTSSKVYGILSPHYSRRLGFYGPLEEGRFRKRSGIAYLCDTCRLRVVEACAAEFGDFDRYAAWVREAPLIGELPDPLVGAIETDSMAPGQGFVELVDVDYVAEALARAGRSMGSALKLVGQHDDHATPFRPPRSYRDVALMQTAPRGGDLKRANREKSTDLERVDWEETTYLERFDWEGNTYQYSRIDFIRWLGSIYRWRDGRILLHWHTVSDIWEVVDFRD